MNTSPKHRPRGVAAWPVAAGLAFVAVTAGCQPAGQGTRNLVLTGSAVMAPMLQEIGRRFEAGHPGVRVDVQDGGSDRGVTDTRAGLADIGMVARPLRPEENRLHAFAIARDGLAVLVHRGNLVPALTPDQVAGIYTRAITNWKEVGGNDVPITPVNQVADSAAAQLFLTYFKIRTTPLPSDLVVGNGGEAIRAVAKRPGAIGYTGVGRATADPDSPIRLLPLAGVPATLETIRAGKYPLSYPLNLVTREPPQGLTKEFLDFARSAEGREVIARFHHVLEPAEGAVPPKATTGTPTPAGRGSATTSAAP
jgi:phosphate transport system substrate-binding protein